jgi:surface antigen
MKKWATCLLAAVFVSGCDNVPHAGQMGGAGLGGMLGVLAGSQIGKGGGRTAAMIAGGLLGMLGGGLLGSRADQNDQKIAGGAASKAFETGQQTTWQNADSHNQGYVVPGAVTRPGCREFQSVAMIGGKKQVVYGTACKDASGDWKIVG